MLNLSKLIIWHIIHYINFSYRVDTDIEDSLPWVAVDCLRSSDIEDPSLGVTDGGFLGQGLGRNLVELKWVIFNVKINTRSHFSWQLTMIYPNSHIPHANKSENKETRISFMVSNTFNYSFGLLLLHWSVAGIRLGIGDYSELNLEQIINYSVLSPRQYWHTYMILYNVIIITFQISSFIRFYNQHSKDKITYKMNE